MASAIVIAVVEQMLNVLKSKELRETCSMFGYESQLDELAVTVLTIKCVLLDAESKHQELTREGRDYIERLKDAVYDVDDLLDEFNTMLQKDKYRKGGKISKKVRRFFSRSNQFLVAFNMSNEIKNLRSKLDKIAKDHKQFGFSDVYVPIKRREATFSYASETCIIGREADKEAIVNLLLGGSENSNNVADNTSFVSIVGIGGLGKTALAQLVYNDCRIERAFEVRLWVCISEDFSMEKILCQMLGKEVYNIEGLQKKVREKIEGRKYLLILDDAWSESRDEWEKLKSYLNLGGKGSKIVVTSRSKKVAKVVGDDMIYELKGLSGEDSWSLFKRLAFKQGTEPLTSDDHMFDISKEIVSKCCNVPLSLRVVGSMLYDQDESMWISLRSSNLMKLGSTENGIMSILKSSFFHLTPALKSCFSYCAVFPKDFVISKELLIRLWVAQGCLGQTENGRSEEDIGDEYFSMLVERCFLQDVQENMYGEIEECKMHDLIHDLAQEVAGRETCVLDSPKTQIDKRIRHLSQRIDECDSCPLISHFSELKTLRTILNVSSKEDNLLGRNVIAICSHLRRLRILDLQSSDLSTLPDTIGNLLHLRYLDLSWNRRLKHLPNSITKLYNLQVLSLDYTSVIELPPDTRKLVNLRHLSLIGCNKLTHMPAGLNELTRLRTLTNFVVGNEISYQDHNNGIGKLRDLEALVEMRGELNIIFRDYSSCEEANYMKLELLRRVRLQFLIVRFGKQGANHETLLACLQPHNTLTLIRISGYEGFKLPIWAESLTTTLPHLVRIQLWGFSKLEMLPSLSQLRHLKCLQLESMPNVEFMESDVVVKPCGVVPLFTEDDKFLFFPSLEELTLCDFPKLKGWWSEDICTLAQEAGASSAVVPSFPRVHTLRLLDCPSLTALPPCPNLKSLELHSCNEALTFLQGRKVVPSHSDVVICLKNLTIDGLERLDCLFGESLRGIDSLKLDCFEGETLPGVAVKYVSQAPIKDMFIWSCSNLKSLSGIEQLTSLQNLSIYRCANLDLGHNEHGVTLPWKTLHGLSYLSLHNLAKLLNLPMEFKYLTSLNTLELSFCENLEALPEWLDCLTFLQTLSIISCSKLKSLPDAISRMPSLRYLGIYNSENLSKRCREPDGEDWPKIHHIPRLYVKS